MDEEGPKPKRRGRPPAPEDRRRRHNLTFRIRSDLREQIETAARENGRSMSEELEHLIERSLDQDTKISARFKGVAGITLNAFEDPEEKAQRTKNLTFEFSLDITCYILESLKNIEVLLGRNGPIDIFQIKDRKEGEA